MALEWSLKLKDGMSGPTQKASDALSVLEKRLKSVKGSSDLFSKQFDKTPPKFSKWSESIGKLFGPKMAKGFQGVQDMLGQRLFGNITNGDALRSIASAGAAAGAAFVAAFAAAAAAVVGVVAAVFGQIASFQQSKGKTLFAFDKLLGPGGGAKAWESIRAAADKTKTPLQETAQAFNNLVAAGFKLEQADTLFKQLADLKTLNPQANIDGIVRAIGQIRNIGKLQGDELNQLSEAGVNVDDVYTELSKRLGKTRDEVMKLKEAGKIKADDAIAAIQASIAKKTGADPGAVAGAAPKSAAESWERLKQKFFDMVNMDFGPLTRFLEKIEKALDGESGAALAAAFEDLSRAVGEALDSMTEEDIAGGLRMAAVVVHDVADGLRIVASMASAVGGFFASFNDTGLKAVWGAIKGIGIAFTSLVTGPIQAAMAAFDLGAWLGPKLAAANEWFLNAQVAFFEGAVSMASMLIQGLVNGITSGASAVVDSIVSMAESAIGAAKGAFEIFSPSKPFTWMGEMNAAGLERGHEKGTPGVASSAADMAGAALGAAAATGLKQTIRNSSTSSSRASTFNIALPPDPSQHDQRTRQLIRQELRLAKV